MCSLIFARFRFIENPLLLLCGRGANKTHCRRKKHSNLDKDWRNVSIQERFVCSRMLFILCAKLNRSILLKRKHIDMNRIIKLLTMFTFLAFFPSIYFVISGHAFISAARLPYLVPHFSSSSTWIGVALMCLCLGLVPRLWIGIEKKATKTNEIFCNSPLFEKRSRENRKETCVWLSPQAQQVTRPNRKRRSKKKKKKREENME